MDNIRANSILTPRPLCCLALHPLNKKKMCTMVPQFTKKEHFASFLTILTEIVSVTVIRTKLKGK